MFEGIGAGMSMELETLGAASAGGLTTRQSADLAGEPCQNCGTITGERYCPNCGQLAASFHRPIWSLVGETISDTLTLDGRLARTLPVLAFRPGRLTKNYISGKRARYVPPFRLFLLASLLFYLMLFSLLGDGSWMKDVRVMDQDGATIATEEVLDAVRAENGDIDREALRAALEAEIGEELTDFEGEAIS